jgi:hypothetical protein
MFYKSVLEVRITFYTYKPMNPFHFLKKHQNRCTLVYIYRAISIQFSQPIEVTISELDET